MADNKGNRRGPKARTVRVSFETDIPPILLTPSTEPVVLGPGLLTPSNEFDMRYKESVARRDTELSRMVDERWVAACQLFKIQPVEAGKNYRDLVVIFSRIFPGFLPRTFGSLARNPETKNDKKNRDLWCAYIRSLEIMRDKKIKRSQAWDKAYREQFDKKRDWLPASSARRWNEFATQPWIKMFRDAAKYQGLKSTGVIDGDNNLTMDIVAAENCASDAILLAEIEGAREWLSAGLPRSFGPGSRKAAK